LPLITYKKTESGKYRYTSLPLFDILNGSINKNISSFEWKEMVVLHLINWGNHYCRIFREPTNDRVIGLKVLEPQHMKVYYDDSSESVVYEYAEHNKVYIYPQKDILHIKNTSNNGLVGLSVIKVAMQSLGVGLAQEEFAGRFYSNGTHIGGFLQHPGALSDNARDNLKKDFSTKYQGLGNSHKAIILEEGMKFEAAGMPLEDAQFIQSREFTIQEVARWLNMPPHKLKDLSRATFSNIEAEQLSFYTDTIRPWLVRIEQAINTQLIGQLMRKSGFVECSENAILRADIQARFNAYSTALQNGFLNRNEIRAMENLNMIDGTGGEIYTAQLNLTDINDLGVNNETNNV
jgi:HK97 family phage portal protein